MTVFIFDSKDKKFQGVNDCHIDFAYRTKLGIDPVSLVSHLNFAVAKTFRDESSVECATCNLMPIFEKSLDRAWM